ncbi:MAG TPA: flagellar biosynthesis protein FlhB [Ignavibacteriales bacterium]|nr:flagellar biosynthesis protein FlhB [Ignavibacteriales bacterium]
MLETPDGQEKTEEATGKRIEEAREKGNVPKSMEINSLLIFTSGILFLILFKGFIAENLFTLSYKIFSNLNTLDLRIDLLKPYTFTALLIYFKILSPLFILLIIVALAANIAQFGFEFRLKPLEPKWTKLNIFSNLKGLLFSSRAVVELGKNILKLAIITIFVVIVIWDFIKNSVELAKLTIKDIINYLTAALFSLIWKLSLVYAAIALLDFYYQRWKFKRDLMMTKQEVKEEFKQTEGDPEIKSRIRSKQLQLARSRMMQEVPKANVVITNPTHFAVALRYDQTKDEAPVVVAKGVDEVALRIKKIAQENNVYIYEDVELARTLFRLCDIGDSIPENLYKAVAKILAYVFQLKEKKTII